jgi:hypothetical protein
LLSAQQQFHQVATSLDQRNNFPRHPRGITPNPPNVLPMSWLSSVTHVLASCREDGCKICRVEGGRFKIWGAKLTWTGRKAGNNVQIVNRDGQHFCCIFAS